MNILRTLEKNEIPVEHSQHTIRFQIGYERFTAHLLVEEWSVNNGTEWADCPTTKDRVEQAIVAYLRKTTLS